VIGVAAAAKGNVTLLIIGLAISIPLVIFGATLLMKVMERWPIIITIGAGLLGWVAGEMLVTDPFWVEWINANMAWHHMKLWKLEFSWIQVIGAAFVVLYGKYLAKKAEAHAEAAPPVVDLAAGDQQNQPNK
jgi:predicted tellurium resistance membrane protein TerC